MINKHLHRHQRRPAAAHLRVEQQHRLVLRDVVRQDEIVQFWLARAHVALDQDAACLAVGYAPVQACFEGGAAAEDDNG
jgi:hypothetical protein